MAILSVKRGQNVVRGSLCEVCAGEGTQHRTLSLSRIVGERPIGSSTVAEVRLRPLAGFVVEPFDVCPHMGRVLIRDTVTVRCIPIALRSQSGAAV